LLDVRGQAGRGETDLFGATDIAIDPQGNIYLVDTVLHRIQKFDSNFQYITSWWTYDEGAEEAGNDHESIVVGPDGRVYATESNFRYRSRNDADPAAMPVSRILVFRPERVV
jgi:sugar lactone lactonase YvrE